MQTTTANEEKRPGAGPERTTARGSWTAPPGRKAPRRRPAANPPGPCPGGRETWRAGHGVEQSMFPNLVAHGGPAHGRFDAFVGLHRFLRRPARLADQHRAQRSGVARGAGAIVCAANRGDPRRGPAPPGIGLRRIRRGSPADHRGADHARRRVVCLRLIHFESDAWPHCVDAGREAAPAGWRGAYTPIIVPRRRHPIATTSVIERTLIRRRAGSSLSSRQYASRSARRAARSSASGNRSRHAITPPPPPRRRPASAAPAPASGPQSRR